MTIVKANKNGMPPFHPGEFLVEDWMKPYGLDILGLSIKTGIKIKILKPITKGKAPVTEDIAQQLAKGLETTPELWMNLQKSYDEKMEARKTHKALTSKDKDKSFIDFCDTAQGAAIARSNSDW